MSIIILFKIDLKTPFCNTVSDYNMMLSQWLGVLYEERKLWGAFPCEKVSWVGLSPIRRSESMNTFFDIYVHPKTILKQSVE